MARTWPLFVLLLAALAAAWVLSGGSGGPGGGGALDRPEEAYVPPTLEGLGPSARGPGAGAAGDAASGSPIPPNSEDGGAVLTGTVVAEEDGAAIPHAWVWAEATGAPCPRLPGIAASAAEGTRPGGPDSPAQEDLPPSALSDEQGRFALRLASAPLQDAAWDVFAVAPGRVLGVACAVAVAGGVEIRLAKGLSLAGRVRTPDGTPVRGARVGARPGPETPPLPGHATVRPARPTDEEGRFTLDGLVAGGVIVEVEHERFMPLSEGPHDPATTTALDLVLTPALLTTFVIRTDDGRVPQHPILLWTRSTKPEEANAVLLDPLEVAADGTVTCDAVRLPCGLAVLSVTVQADGYAAWRGEALRPPPEGGERTIEVKLLGDRSTGTVRIALEDETGARVRADANGVVVGLAVLDPAVEPSAYVMKPGEDVEITALPAGRYRVRLASPSFAPLETDVVVTAGQEARTTLRTRPPAQLRVRFVSAEAGLVRFDLTQDGRIVQAFPVGATPTLDPETGETVLTAGADGLLLTGLGAGTYAIEVKSAEYGAPVTRVRLFEGETEEVEISVSRR